MNKFARHAGWWLPLLVVLIYWPSLDFPFQFDDYNVIVDNPAVHSVAAWWQSMPGIRPLLKLSYALSWQGAADPAAFRAFNITLHALNAVLVWLILSELARRRSLPAMVPLLAATLFALHPIQTEAVTYISGRSVTLMAFFYLLSLLSWLLATRTAGHARRWLQLLSGIAFLCAFLSKETAIILPAALWLITWLAPQASARLHAPAPLPESPVAAAWFMVRSYRWPIAITIAAIIFLLLLPAYRHFFSVGLAQRTPLENLALQMDSVFFLTTHLLQPALMNADPALPVTVRWGLPLAVKAMLLATIVGLAALAFRHRSFVGFCVLWFFLHLAPTNSFIPRLDAANDRQLYLSTVGVFALAALLAWHGLRWLRRKLRARHEVADKLAPLLLTLALLVQVGWQTVERNHVYRNEISFWQDVTTKSPHNARAFNNLGYAYQLAGQPLQARTAYQHALMLAPTMPQPRWNLESLSPPDTTARSSPARPSSAH